MHLDEVTGERLAEASDEELLSLHRRCHQLWSNADAELKERIKRAHGLIVAEMERRGMAHASELKVIADGQLPEIVPVIPEFVSIVGSSVQANQAVETGSDVDVLIRSDHDQRGRFMVWGDSIIVPLRKILDPLKRGILHFILNPSGPHAESVPLYDLAMVRREPRRIDLGCGDAKPEGYIGIDISPGPQVDIVRDIRWGLPFGDNTVDEVRASHVLEHLQPDEYIWVMWEIWRVLRHGGKLELIVPHKNSRGALLAGHQSLWDEDVIYQFSAPLAAKVGFPQFEVVELALDDRGDGIVDIRAQLLAAKTYRFKAASIKPIARPKVMPHPADRYYTDHFSPDELWETWGKDKAPLLAELKYNGFRAYLQKRGRQISLLFDGVKGEQIDRFPELEELCRQIGHDFILDCDIGISQGGKPWPRVRLMVLMAKEPKLPEGARLEVHVFDVIYWDNPTVELTQLERRRLLETAVKPELPETAAIRMSISDGVVVETLEQLREAYKDLGTRPGSEGLVTKQGDAKYPWDVPATSAWSKIKNVLEFKVIVLDKKTTRNGMYGYLGGITADIEVENVQEMDGRMYVRLGWTMNTQIDAEVGDIITVQIPELIWADDSLTWMNANVVDVDPTRKTPYTARQSISMARRAHVLQDVRGVDVEEQAEGKGLEEEPTRAEVSAKWWAENWYKVWPESGKGSWVLQHHWRGLSAEEAELDEEELLKTDHSIHGDLRFTSSMKDMLWGVSLFYGTTEAVAEAGGDRLAALRDTGDYLQCAFKLPEPIEWLTVARRKPFISFPGGIGSTSRAYSKFFEYDHGTYEMGVWREHMLEVFLNGSKIKGRMVIMFAPVGGQRTWITTMPEDQTPYADQHKLEDVVAELRKKHQKYLIWAKPGQKPELIDVADFKPTEEA